MPQTLMDGTEQTLFENSELGEYGGYIFLNNIQTNDVVELRCYIKDVEDSVYKLREGVSFSGTQNFPSVEMRLVLGKVGIRVTAKQTAGTYRNITHMWFKR